METLLVLFVGNLIRLGELGQLIVAFGDNVVFLGFKSNLGEVGVALVVSSSADSF